MYGPPPIPPRRSGVPGVVVGVVSLVCLGFGSMVGCAVGMGIASAPPPEESPAAAASTTKPPKTKQRTEPSEPGPATTTSKPPSTFGEGTHRVPQDVKPGTYKTTGGDGCYWARLRNLSGSFSAILANGNPQGPATVTISKGDKGFETHSCEDWKKVSG